MAKLNKYSAAKKKGKNQNKYRLEGPGVLGLRFRGGLHGDKFCNLT